MDYYFGTISSDDKIILEEDESNHLIHVRRSKVGDLVKITDGEGNLYIAELLRIDKKHGELIAREKIRSKKKPYHLHIALAPTKSIDRIEWFLEKATETGVDEISFFISRHSERKEVKIDRLKRVALSAIKQSQKTFLPKLNPAVEFKKFIIQQFNGTKLICSMAADEHDNMKKNYQPGHSLTVLIGPEGDFHADELALAREAGFHAISLGISRLRAETAALNVCTIFNFMNA